MGIKTFVYVEGAGRGNWELQSLLVKNMKPVTLNYSKSNHCDSSSVVVPPPHPGEQVWAKSNLNEGFSRLWRGVGLRLQPRRRDRQRLNRCRQSAEIGSSTRSLDLSNPLRRKCDGSIPAG